jgi:hypothetical protein
MKRAVLWIVPSAAAALSVALAGTVLGFPHGRDQWIFSVVAAAIVDGGTPYADVWDYKTPGVFLVYALARLLVGPGTDAVRWLEVLGLASLAVPFALLSRRWIGDGRPGLLALALVMVAYVPLGFWHTAQPESFGGVLLAWALLGVTDEGEGPTRRALCRIGAGALFGLATLMKPTLALPAVASALLAARRSGSVAGLSLLAVGAACPLLLVGAWLGGRGALDDLWWTLAVYAPSHTALGYREVGPISHFSRAVADFFGSVHPVGAVGVVLLLWLAPVHPREREGVEHALGVVSALIVGVAIQAMFFRYHHAATLIVLSLPAAWGFWKLALASVSSARRLAVAAPLALAGLALVLPLEEREQGVLRRDRLADAASTRRLAAYSNAANEEVARWVGEHTPAGSRLFVWGSEPSLYGLSGRIPASRFVYDEPLRAPWSRDATRAELMADLEQHPPAAIVVQRGDAFPFLTDSALDSAEELEQFDALERLLRASYERAVTFEQFDVWLRRP